MKEENKMSKRKTEWMIKEIKTINGEEYDNVYPVSKKEFMEIIDGDISKIQAAYKTDYIDDGNRSDCFETYYVSDFQKATPKREPYGWLEELDVVYQA